MRLTIHSPLSVRFSSFAKALIVSFALFVGMSALFGRYASASAKVTIPEDAIRIRIIANSDGEFDQKVKQAVRESVSEAIVSWGDMPANHDEAEKLIRGHLKQIQRIVDAKLLAAGVSYKGVAELGDVPFPEKEFKGTSYAAGDYEALRITLGEGEGANWWCVLFPPMCLTAATAQEDAKAAEATAKPVSAREGADGEADKPKPAFFLWVIIRKIIEFFAGLFS